jgi:hypothetical protein
VPGKQGGRPRGGENEGRRDRAQPHSTVPSGVNRAS